MKIIISPTKTMNRDLETQINIDYPLFLKETKIVKNTLLSMTKDELRSLWRCSDKILELNIDRLKNLDLEKNLSPALFSYEGIQFQYMDSKSFNGEELEFLNEHLIILSGFYGMLRPLDGIIEHRLDLQDKIKIGDDNLYDFWGERVIKYLEGQTDIVVNLASKEYSKLISQFKDTSLHFINIYFKEDINGKLVEKGTFSKMARGEMVKFCAHHRVVNVENLKNFNSMGYRFKDDLSDDNNYIFTMN